jgi:hypothetical protein
VRPCEPVARRIYRYSSTGHEVMLRVERELAGEGEEPPRWWVDLGEAPGAPAWMPKLRYMACTLRAECRPKTVQTRNILLRSGHEMVDHCGR